MPNKQKNEAAQTLGRLGGLKTKQKYDKNYYSELAKKRWAKKQDLQRETDSLEA
jgi:hypothetical protein